MAAEPKPRKNIDGVIQPAEKPVKKRIKFPVIPILLIIIAVLAATIIGNGSSNKPEAKVDDVTSVKTAINQHYLLPTDEEPALATVTDKSKISSALAKKAENGDRILIYQNNKTAIIYRPSIDKVVDVVQVNIDNAPQPD